MQSNKDHAAPDRKPEAAADTGANGDETLDPSQEATLEWLMELDRDDPVESVFIVERRGALDLSLSAQEAAVAARPMMRGRANADDLSTYVEEEIVLGEPGAASAGSAQQDDDDAAENEAFDGLMAVDFSREVSAEEEGLLRNVRDGSDILGLEDDDDIGDQYLVVKRVKKQEGAASTPAPVAAAEASPTVTAEATGVAVQEAEAAEPEVIELEAAEPEVIEIEATEPESIEIEAADVADYVSTLATPQDEDALDDYLVAGSELAAQDECIEEIELADVAEPVAAEPGHADDFHEDLAAVARGEDHVGAVTGRIAALVAELDTALVARLSALGLSPGSVQAEVAVAPDAAAEAESRSAGFLPVSEICSDTPEALSDLEPRQLQMVFLRLRAVDGVDRNRIFLEDPPREDAAGVAVERTLEPGLRLVETRVFEEDLLGDELDVSPETSEWIPDGDEIDAIFSSLDADPMDAVLDQPPPVDDDDSRSMLEEAARAVEETFTGLSAAEYAVEEISGPSTASDQDDMSWCIPADIEFSRCSPSSGEIFAEFLDAFIEEGASELEKLEDAVGQWEADVANAESRAVVGRVLHTIKGIAKGVGLHFYGTLIHNFETLLEAMPRPAAGAEADYFRVVNAWLDAAVRGMDFVQTEHRDIPSELPHRYADTGAEAGAGEAAARFADQAEPAAADVAVDTPALTASADAATDAEAEKLRRQEDKKLADEGARVLAQQQSVRITSEKLDLLLNLTNQAQQLGVRTAQSATRTKRATAELQGRLTSIRAHIGDIASGSLFNVTARGGSTQQELDALEMDRYSELQEAANILREGVEDLADLIEMVSRHNSQAENLLKQQATVISSIGSSMRAARVVPVSRLTPGLRRMVRTVAADLRKEVAFRVVNEIGTLDRDDYTRCQTILEHMVRNALDHGIESARERQAAGKQSVGQITLDVRKSGGDAVIVLSDDGRGMDPDRIRESAVRKGLDVDPYQLSDEEALNLIFHKGFSTAEELSQISGRGVGMDIVASELQQMGGDIRIVSEVGKGTSFHIRIPTNVAVNGALLVSAGESSYAIPLGGLIAVDEVPVDKFFSAVENGEKLPLSGMECEPAYLGTLCKSGNLPERSGWRGTIPVIIAGSDARYMAVAVDDVEEALELEIRSLGGQFAAVPGVAGGATTADGEAVVALDLNVLVSCFGEEQGTAVAVDQPREEKLLALVVDDSRTQRMVATSQLETVGLETATAENGAVAIDWLNTTERLPDVVLMDVEMPVKDGIQALREIRKSPRFNHIPVIMITSRTGVKHRTLAEEAGCNGYMGKPFNFRMLIGQINDLTGQRLDLDQH